MTKLEQFKVAREVYLTLVNDSTTEIIADVFADLQQRFPSFNAAVITGSTPQWNDGETCYHSTEISVQDAEEYHEFDYETNTDLSRADQRIIEAELDLVDVILLENHGTNYQLVAKLKDGRFEITVDDYDCGY